MLAKASGVGYPTICRLERGKEHAYPCTITKLAKALHTTPYDLTVHWDDDKSELSSQPVIVDLPSTRTLLPLLPWSHQ